VPGAHAAHVVLFAVKVRDLFVDAAARLADQVHVGRVVAVAGHLAVAHHDSLDPLVAKDPARPAAPGLLDASFFAAHIIPAEVQPGVTRMFGALPRRHHRHTPPVALVLRIHLGQEPAEQVRVERFERRLLDRHAPLVAVDDDDHVPLGDPLDFQRIPAGEFQVGAEIPARVAVDHGAGQRRHSHHGRFARPRIGGDAADRPTGDHNLVFWGIPSRLAGSPIPQQPQAEPATAGEDVLHLLCDRLAAHGVRREVDVERAVGVAALHRMELVCELS